MRRKSRRPPQPPSYTAAARRAAELPAAADVSAAAADVSAAGADLSAAAAGRPIEPPPPPPAAPPEPPPPTYSDPTYTDLNADVAGNDVPSVDVFYDQLSPYGTWYDDATYGWVFTPNDGGLSAVHQRPVDQHRVRLHLGVERSVRLGHGSLRPLGVGEPLGVAP